MKKELEVGFMSIFSRRVQQLMQRDAITQKKLSELSHISEPSLCRYLSDKTKPRMDIVINIARVFGVPSSYLSGESDELSNANAYEETYNIVARNKTKLSVEEKAKIIKILFEET
ncbi:MAG: helix-turn-helix transcriptional regulator [Clostridia bacterium]|nr:helix-turn-helix transcriptional regulator [Clostridia bacterium]